MKSGSETLSLGFRDRVGNNDRGSWTKKPRPSSGTSCIVIVMHSNTGQFRSSPEVNGEKLKGSDMGRYAF